MGRVTEAKDKVVRLNKERLIGRGKHFHNQ